MGPLGVVGESGLSVLLLLLLLLLSSVLLFIVLLGWVLGCAILCAGVGIRYRISIVNGLLDMMFIRDHLF